MRAIIETPDRATRGKKRNSLPPGNGRRPGDSRWHPAPTCGKTGYMAMLITLQGPDAGRKYSLEGDATVLGRQAACPICRPAKAVSRQHAQIVREDDAYFLEALDSSNGTFLNGARLSPRVRVILAEQDT